MIEIVTFGEGLRLDDPGSWGRTLPYLETGWQRLEPGVHVLDKNINPVDRLATSSITVMSDGRGRFSTVLNPYVMTELIRAEGMSAIAKILSVTNLPIDERRRAQLLGNIKLSESMDAKFPIGCLRLMGVVRYNS